MTDMNMKRFNSRKQQVTAKPMTRLAYNELRGWELPVDECGADDGYLTVDINADSNFEGYDGHVSWKPKALFENQYYEVDAALFADVDDSVAYDDSDDDAQYTDEASVCGYGGNGSTRQGLSLDQELMRDTIALISPKYADSRTDNMLDDANKIVSAIMGRDSQVDTNALEKQISIADRVELVPCATVGVPAIVNYIQFDGANHEEVMQFFDGHHASEGVSFLMGDDTYLGRMRKEFAVLDSNTTKLITFLSKPKPDFVSVYQWEAMQDQCKFMQSYREILNMRINNAMAE